MQQYSERVYLNVHGSVVNHGDSLCFYANWEKPNCIISDGPYGLGKFPGETNSSSDLPSWYEPHISAWYEKSAPNCTLWFWGSELSWATVHPVLDRNGWQYEETAIWDKGIAHIAGNVNSKTIRGLPIATEVSARYTRRNLLQDFSGNLLTIKQWVRSEWLRSGIPMNLSNEACGLKNAATRKYMTQCHRWYFPPADAMELMAHYCAKHGKPTIRPYFSMDGESEFDGLTWNSLRSKWNHTHGITNVWTEPPVHGKERIKSDKGYLHANQKPMSLMKRQILSCTDIGDVVWEPFGGLCSASLAAKMLGRKYFSAEVNDEFFAAASNRIKSEDEPDPFAAEFEAQMQHIRSIATAGLVG